MFDWQPAMKTRRTHHYPGVRYPKAQLLSKLETLLVAISDYEPLSCLENGRKHGITCHGLGFGTGSHGWIHIWLPTTGLNVHAFFVLLPILTILYNCKLTHGLFSAGGRHSDSDFISRLHLAKQRPRRQLGGNL